MSKMSDRPETIVELMGPSPLASIMDIMWLMERLERGEITELECNAAIGALLDEVEIPLPSNESEAGR